MSDLVGNPEDRFSRVAAHIKCNNFGESVQVQVKSSSTDYYSFSNNIMKYMYSTFSLLIFP